MTDEEYDAYMLKKQEEDQRRLIHQYVWNEKNISQIDKNSAKMAIAESEFCKKIYKEEQALKAKEDERLEAEAAREREEAARK